MVIRGGRVLGRRESRTKNGAGNGGERVRVDGGIQFRRA